MSSRDQRGSEHRGPGRGTVPCSVAAKINLRPQKYTPGHSSHTTAKEQGLLCVQQRAVANVPSQLRPIKNQDARCKKINNADSQIPTTVPQMGIRAESALKNAVHASTKVWSSSCTWAGPRHHSKYSSRIPSGSPSSASRLSARPGASGLADGAPISRE